MALDFTDYSTLVTSIAAVLHRSDLNNDIPGFVDLCEADMNRRLKVGDSEASTTLTLPTTGSVALPTGFTKMRRLRLYDGSVYYDLTEAALAPSEYDGVTQGRPLVVSIVGSNIVSRPLPTQSYTLYIDYYAKFTALSGTSTNWILTSHPDAYLYGSLLHSAPFLGQDLRIQTWNQAYEKAIRGINRADFEKRFSQLKTRSDMEGLNSPGRFDINTGYAWP